MKTKLVYLVILMVIIGISGCKKKCGSFDDKLLPWIAFQQKEHLTFSDQFSDSLRFDEIIEYESSEYNAENYISEPCFSSAVFMAVFSSNETHKLYFQIDEARNKIRISLDIRYPYGYDSIYMYDYEKTGHFEREYKSLDAAIQSVTINGKEYTEALVFEEDTTQSAEDVWKCIIIKNHGVMQFYERGGAVWTLNE